MLKFKIFLHEPDIKRFRKMSNLRVTLTQESDKGYNIKPIIDHLNKSFQNSYINEPEQSIEEHTAIRLSIRQYFKCWF